MHLKCFLVFQLLIFVFIKTECTENGIVRGPQNCSVFDRELCVKQITKKDILSNYKSYYENTGDTRVLTSTLGLLETHQVLRLHNDKGSRDAITFAQKFSMLSPFQLTIQRIGPEKYEIAGTNWLNDNKKWIKNLTKATQKELKILPVLKFLDWKPSDFIALAISDKEIITLGLEVLRIAQDLQLQGLILDIWPEFYGKIPTTSLILIIQEIAARLRYDVKLALLLIPPEYANKHVINRERFEILTDFVNNIIFEMYDYSSAWTPGPNSPIPRIEKYVNYLTPDPLTKRNSIIIGINFFGNVYTPLGISKITGDEYIELLENNDIEFKFDEEAVEHYFEIDERNEKHLIYYPTLYSIRSRVRLANKLGIGLAVIKVGQGLDYFYDVL